MTIAYAVATHAGESCYYVIGHSYNVGLKGVIIMFFIKCCSPHKITTYIVYTGKHLLHPWLRVNHMGWIMTGIGKSITDETKRNKKKAN